jgi:hypothetical protein
MHICFSGDKQQGQPVEAEETKIYIGLLEKLSKNIFKRPYLTIRLSGCQYWRRQHLWGYNTLLREKETVPIKIVAVHWAQLGVSARLLNIDCCAAQ